MRTRWVLGLWVLAACTGKYVRPTTDEKVELTPERLARGQYLVDSVGACGGCHTTWKPGSGGYLAGDNVIENRAQGFLVWVPNLTPDAETGLGRWSDDEVMRAIRDGVHADGHLLLSFMPFPSYQHLSDDDVRAVVAYLRSVPPVKLTSRRPGNETPFVMGLFLRGGVTHHAPAHDVKGPAETDLVGRGAYLAEVAHCPACHALGEQGQVKRTDPLYMAGSAFPLDKGLGKIWSANLTPDRETGLGRYDGAQIKHALTTGRRLDGALMGPPMSELSKHFATMRDEDLDAVVAWLQSLTPISHAVPPRELNATGKAQLEASQ